MRFEGEELSHIVWDCTKIYSWVPGWVKVSCFDLRQPNAKLAYFPNEFTLLAHRILSMPFECALTVLDLFSRVEVGVHTTLGGSYKLARVILPLRTLKVKEPFLHIESNPTAWT